MKKPRSGGAFFWASTLVPAPRRVAAAPAAGPERRGARARACAYSPSVSSEALPPAAVVLMVTVFSVAKRGR